MPTSLRFLLLFFALHFLNAAQAQEPPPRRIGLLEPADSLDRTRFWLSVGGGTAIYSAVSVGLYEAWYKGFERSAFHTFNDWGEWRHMDKAGHILSAHLESHLAFKGALWTGMNRRSAMWSAVGVGMLLQSTIEVMDGFSAKWGFSLSDMGANVLGAGMFLGQEALWQDQRILMKASYTDPGYSTAPIWSEDGTRSSSLLGRANSLYGASFAERFLKDYNGLTVWASVNPASFFPENKKPAFLPRWLNVAAGYSGANLYGGFENRWEEGDAIFVLDPAAYPRYSQYYLSLDVDFTRIRTRSYLLKTVFNVISWIKVPAPALELNSRGRMRLHPLMW
jgi:hypothetical protein